MSVLNETVESIKKFEGRPGETENFLQIAVGYGAPTHLFIASQPFLISIGNTMSWSKWTQTETL
ncbi:14801_t:CDS:2 [Dentiscutata erythropus]|uniref:14801_t:CDS:1 n=1 Tax=Dentiscutata erythropus TaxID=1348616 RepID=A0A9N8YRZ4_9GLOM|nr:14801_t:CDS:2 [Dentiscutata erythropus]